MKWSLGVAAAAVVAVAALVVPARAQERPGDILVNEAKKPRASVFPSLSQFSGYGMSTGYMKVMGGDLGKKTQAKPVMQMLFRYRFSETWIGVGEFGFGWNSFKDAGDTVLTFNFGTLGAARRVGHIYGSDLRASAGLGFYRFNYKFNGQSLRDSRGPLVGGVYEPGTQRFYRGIAPGGYIGLEDEYRLTRHVTLLGLLQQHYVLTADKDRFNSIFDKNYAILSFRLGVTFHFSPYEGILWEGKKVKKIRLESGKEGR
jgi:hypothetical protein